jgi:urease accessory protein
VPLPFTLIIGTKMSAQLLSLLQLASPALPVGGYSYSEGLESLIQGETIVDAKDVSNWLKGELIGGSIRIDGAIVDRVYEATIAGDRLKIGYWNSWLTAQRETEELRLQSLQMGGALWRLTREISPPAAEYLSELHLDCHYPIAYAVTAAVWEIDRRSTILSYLHAWVANLVGAAIKLVPLGQTDGQRILLALQPNIIAATDEVFNLPDDNLYSCSWGLSLASMYHETLYSRLFRS